jgi:hypothetical protein
MTFTANQQAFINDNSAERQAAAKHAITQGTLFADVTVCLFGQYATGYVETACGKEIPCLYLTADEANEDLLSMRQTWIDSIADGERDEGDEYEGTLFRVRWNADDTLSFFDPTSRDDSQLIASRTLNCCAGI